MSFLDKLASLKVDAIGELNREEASKPRKSRQNSKSGRSPAPKIPEQPPYVFNFNDIPTIRSEVHGIKSLEASISAAHGDVPEGESASPAKVPVSLEDLQKPTLMQPKGPGQEFSNMDQDRIREAFSKTDFMGIRSLPNALEPNFRETLYKEVLGLTAMDTEKQREVTYRRGQNALLAATQTMFSHSESVGPGLKRAGRLSALPGEMTGAFSTYVHQGCPYEAEEEMRRADQAEQKSKMICQNDFTVRTIERALQNSGSFNTPSYSHNPYEDMEDKQRHIDKMTKEAQLRNTKDPWIASGRIQELSLLKVRIKECLSELGKYCMDNWPNSFKRLFEDKTGCLVMEFDSQAAEQEGDLSSFMNHMAKTHITVIEFQLQRDPTKWGLFTEGGESPGAYYVMWPPWVNHRIAAPEHLSGPVPQTNKLLWESRPPLPVDRIPFIEGRYFAQEYIKRIDERSFR